jgi:hypothetical protein
MLTDINSSEAVIGEKTITTMRKNRRERGECDFGLGEAIV